MTRLAVRFDNHPDILYWVQRYQWRGAWRILLTLNPDGATPFDAVNNSLARSVRLHVLRVLNPAAYMPLAGFVLQEYPA